METLQLLSKVLEPIYYFASIGLFATVIIGLFQLKLLKEDIKTKNQRATIEKSLEYLDWFATEFFPIVNKYQSRRRELKETLIDKTTDSEDKKLLQRALNKKVDIEIEVTDLFCKNDRECKDFEVQISVMQVARVDQVLNQLEYFSAAMTSGLANEELAFDPLSEAFCDLVQEHYFVLCKIRGSNNKLYSNIIKLYKIWKPRIDKELLQDKHKELSEKISKLPETKIKAIGQ